MEWADLDDSVVPDSGDAHDVRGPRPVHGDGVIATPGRAPGICCLGVWQIDDADSSGGGRGGDDPPEKPRLAEAGDDLRLMDHEHAIDARRLERREREPPSTDLDETRRVARSDNILPLPWSLGETPPDNLRMNGEARKVPKREVLDEPARCRWDPAA